MKPKTFNPTSISFLREGEHDLEGLLKSLKGLNKEAVRVMEKGIKDSDPKVALAYLKLLLELQVEISKDISTDSLARVVAEIKLSNSIGSGERLISDNDVPLIDFGKIQDLQ